jgi:hypothetical protein
MDGGPGSFDARGALDRLADELCLPPGCAESASGRLAVIARQDGFGDRPPLAALLAALGGAACDDGDHEGELRAARAQVVATDEHSAGDRVRAWLAVLAALEHLTRRAADRRQALVELRGVAVAACTDLHDRLEAEAAPQRTVRAALDAVSGVLLPIEEELGLALSAPAADLLRRRRARAVHSAASPTFGERHRDGIEAMRARDAQSWHAERFADRHGAPPPAGWWAQDPGAPSGGWIAPEYRDLFDAADQAAFVDDIETRYRAEHGLPARGEGWVSQPSLASCVEAALPGVEVVREARPPWLGRQRLDVYVPSLDLALEYQGEQHFLPFAHLGGEEGLARRRELDERKRYACLCAGVRLVEWRFDEPISVARVRERLGLQPYRGVEG